MTQDGGTLESLDLQDHMLQKLEGIGIQSISDLATTTTSEFLESYYSNYDEGIGGIDFETISQLVLKAKQKLIEHGLLQKEFSSAEKMLEIRQNKALEEAYANIHENFVMAKRNKQDIDIFYSVMLSLSLSSR